MSEEKELGLTEDEASAAKKQMEESERKAIERKAQEDGSKDESEVAEAKPVRAS